MVPTNFEQVRTHLQPYRAHDDARTLSGLPVLPLLFIGRGSSAAMPLFFNETPIICQRGLCEKTDMKYERISVSQPGYHRRCRDAFTALFRMAVPPVLSST
jgi:hypothetical protein